jgi:acyl-CoA synthetase (AMP-forming)/AMP-acid ligase II
MSTKSESQARADPSPAQPGGAHPLSQMIRNALDREASRPAVEFEKHWYTWGDLRRVADRVQALIAASGAPPRAPVALIGRNRPFSVAALLGLIAGGHTIYMVYPFQAPIAIARNLERLQPAVVVAAASEFSEEVCAVLSAHGMAGVVIADMDATALAGFERATRREIAAPAEPRIEILTSGTTGAPKQFPVSYDLVAKHHVASKLVPQRSEQEIFESPPMLLYFPLGNISGIYSTIPTLAVGQRAVLLDRFTLEEWRDYIVRFKPVGGALPPAGVQMVLDADIPAEELASVRFVGTGAAPLDPSVQRAFEERYGIPILLSYGATEFGGPVAAMTPEMYAQFGKAKLGTVGKPLPGAQVRVVDANTGEALPHGQEGILEVISPRIGSHWIRTSDIGVIDEDGFIFHRGRADGAIVRGGFKLLPETIERVLMLHPAISAVAVAGIPDRRLGQVPAAVIQLKPQVPAPGIAELEAHLREHLLSTHIPAAWRFVEELPKNPSMKVDRVAVRRLFESENAA